MSSPENPQFDPQRLSSEAQMPLPPAADPLPPSVLLPVQPQPQAGENPVWSGSDVLLIAGLTALLSYLVVPILIASAAHIFIYTHETWIEVARKPVLALLSQFLAYVLVALFMVMLVEGKYHARFWRSVRWNWPGISSVSFLGLGILMISLDALAKYLPMPKSTPFEEFFAHPTDAYLVAVFSVTLGPLMEELLFRGFLYPVLARRTGAMLGIIITGVLFGLVHLPQYGFSWAAALIIVLVGIVLTTVRAVTKSVASSFLAHVGYNGALMALTALATDGFRHMDKAGVLVFWL